jgi:hypothetical protein
LQALGRRLPGRASARTPFHLENAQLKVPFRPEKGGETIMEKLPSPLQPRIEDTVQVVSLAKILFRLKSLTFLVFDVN